MIVGRLGDGKTLLLCLMAMIFKYSSSKSIMTNFKLDYADGYITNMKGLDSVKQSMIGLDDGYMELNSRDIRGNKAALLVCARNRKRGNDLFITTVRAKQIDINVRFNVEVIWMPRTIPSPVKGNPPILLSAIGYEYRPEEEDEKYTIGRPLYFISVQGNLLRKIMNSYDTTQEIDTMAEG